MAEQIDLSDLESDELAFVQVRFLLGAYLKPLAFQVHSMYKCHTIYLFSY